MFKKNTHFIYLYLAFNIFIVPHCSWWQQYLFLCPFLENKCRFGNVTIISTVLVIRVRVTVANFVVLYFLICFLSL